MIINPYIYGGGGDPYFSSVISLAPFLDANGSTGPFVDIIANRSPGWTRHAVGPTTDGTSLGPADVGVYNANHADWDFGSGDYTVECYFSFSELTSAQVLFCKGNLGTFMPFLVYFQGGGGAGVLQSVASNNGSSYAYNVNSGTLSISTLYHLAQVRSGNSMYSWLDGVQFGATGTMTGAIHTNSVVAAIGSTSDANAGFAHTGRIKAFRATKGVARYTATFTPPGLPLPTF